MSDGAVFAARRALWAILLNLLMGLLLAGFTVVNVVRQLREGGSPVTAGIFAIVAVFFLWQVWTQLRDRAPQVEVGPDGLRLPGAAPEAVPWTRVRHVAAARGLPGLGGGRIDVTVDAELFEQMKFGQRFMGDIVVKRRSMPNTLSIITPQLDENADAIYAAVKRYWPPPVGPSEN